jgi:hypothetical protein
MVDKFQEWGRNQPGLLIQGGQPAAGQAPAHAQADQEQLPHAPKSCSLAGVS